MKLLPALAAAVLASGCAATTSVEPVAERIAEVCIQENPKVAFGEFLRVVDEGLQRHGIATRIFTGARPADCEYRLTYMAARSWGPMSNTFRPQAHLSYAELHLDRNGRDIGGATYDQGALARVEFASVKDKLDPVIDQMLAAMKVQP